MITLDNFEAYVPYKIWERGEEYYESDAVSNLEETSEGEWSATVEGTNDYEVEVSIEDGEVTFWDCDCPYEGEVCKHVVATVLAIRDQQKKASRSAFSIKGKKSARMEDAVVIEDMDSVVNPVIMGESAIIDKSVVIDKSVNESSFNSDLKRLLSLFNHEELSLFVLEYAAQSAEFSTTLQNRILSKKLSSTDKDLRAEVCKAFHYSTVSSRSRYHRYDEWVRDWEAVFDKIDVFWEKARRLVECGNFDGAITIALQVLQSIGEEYDDELLYNDSVDVSCSCEEAGDLIIEIVKEHTLSQKQKDWILQELCRIAEISTYRDYDIYDVDELVQTISILTQPADKALALMDKLLKETKDDWRLYEMVIRKIELLQKMNDQKKIDETVQRYLYLPEIREQEVDRHIEKNQYAKAIHLLDEGIRIAEKEDDLGTKHEWMEKKLTIYEKMKNTTAVIELCRQLFISTTGDLEYYKKLKELIPVIKWKEFLKSMMQETEFRGSIYFLSNHEADIYVCEKDNDALFHLLESGKGSRLDDLMKYAPHLRETHSEALLILFNTQLKKYAEDNMGRSHYQYIAKVLRIMQKLKGGDEAVQQLTLEFRVTYKRRTAMIDELRKF